MKDIPLNYFTNHDTALVTGASSGMGLEFAQNLAQKGVNLILVARREEKLKKISTHLSSEFNVQVEYLVADLSKESDITIVLQKIQVNKEKIDIIINCAGYGTQGQFTKIPFKEYNAMIQLQIYAPTKICYAILPFMLEKNKGIIINVASMGAFTPVKGNVIYNATKSYLVTFTENLAKELDRNDIIVQALCPGFTQTEFHEVGYFKDFNRKRIPRKMWMSSEDVIKYSINSLQKRRIVAIPGLKNRLVVKMYKSFIIQSYMKARRTKSKKK